MSIRAPFDAPAVDEPFVFATDGHQSLYFTLDQLQSRMCCAEPTRLEVDYTRTMMGFLLFDSQPNHIAMIGLGGGSLLKFCYRHLPKTRFTVIEINPQVIGLREQFEIPADDQRLQTVCADGADFIRQIAQAATPRYDVLLVDGFDSQGQAPSLCSQAFYLDCFDAIAPQGLMVVNLHHDDPLHGIYTGHIRHAFFGNHIEVASREKSNSVVFARKGEPISIDELRRSNPMKSFSAEVRAQLTGEFARITWAMTGPFLPSV